jgi:hypothetical protein
MLRRLANPERAFGPATPRVTAVALRPDAGDRMAPDDEWIIAPNSRPPWNTDVPMKLYIGCDPDGTTRMSAVRLDSRLRQLEAAVPTGCPACRDRRGRALMHFSRQNLDGRICSVTDDPRPCQCCGEVPGQAI